MEAVKNEKVLTNDDAACGDFWLAECKVSTYLARERVTIDAVSF